jgi:hypothetical protein
MIKELKKKLKKMNNKLNLLNSSKFVAGIAMIMLNIGSKYVPLGFSKNQEAYLKNGVARQMLIFSIAWMGSKDLVISLLLTAAFTLLAGFVLNENSKYCMLPDKWQHLYELIDTNNDGELSVKELEKAIDVLNKTKNLKSYDFKSNSSKFYH